MQQLKLWLLSLVLLFVAVPLVGQTITAHTEFHSVKAQKTINVEDDLYLRFALDKPLSSIIMKRGTEGIQTIYGVLKINFDGSEFLTDAFPVAYTETASIQEFDLALSLVMKDFQALAREYKGDWTGKDHLLVNVLAQPNNPLNTWMRAIAAAALPEATQPVQVEFYIMESTKEPYTLSPAVATGTFDVKVGKDALFPLYGTRIPAVYQPVLDDGIVDDFHKKNVTHILWSNQLVLAKKANTKAIKSSFSVEEQAIYGRVYLNKSVRNFAAGVGKNKACTFNVHYYLDDKLIEKEAILLEPSACEKATTLPIVLWSEKEQTNLSLRDRIQELTTGEHVLKVVLDLDYKEGNTTRRLPMASSTITLMK